MSPLNQIDPKIVTKLLAIKNEIENILKEINLGSSLPSAETPDRAAAQASRPGNPQASKSGSDSQRSQGGLVPPTEKQLKRLWAIMKEAGWSEDEVRNFMDVAWKIGSTKELTKDRYEYLCNMMPKTQYLDAMAKVHK